jgi:hypothetical protein
MGNLAEWIDVRMGFRPKAPPALDYVKSLPPRDADGEGDDTEEDYLDENDLQGQSFIIEYCDSAGEISTRCITVRKLDRSSDGCLCLSAHCWERDAFRKFRVDRILSLRRRSDPTPLGNASQFFEQYMHDGVDGYVAALMKTIRPGIRVLLYLARCDGGVHPAEVDVIREYVNSHAATPVDWPVIQKFIDDQHPDAKLARSMLKCSLINRAGAIKLLSAAKKLADADGVLAPEEIATLDQMYKFSEARRYQEDIR